MSIDSRFTLNWQVSNPVSKFAKLLLISTLGVYITGCYRTPMAMPLSSQSAPSSAKGGQVGNQALSNQVGSYQVRVTADVAYGQDARQRLDIYTPADGQRHPVLVFVYGGSWQSGKRQTYAFVGRQFAKAGYTTVVMDYRLAPAHVFPDYVLDTTQAVGWVYRNIANYGGNPEQLFIMGHSAGAFNAVSAVDDKRFWAKSEVPDKALRGVIGLAGPYDYDFRLGNTQVAFPPNSTREQVMPVYHIRSGVPPHLLVTGSKDTLVYPQNADSLQQALIKAGGNVERIEVPANHAGVVLGLSKPLQPFYPTFDKINAFLQRQLAN